MKLIDKILTEWAYRVHDGMPDPSNPLHLINLDEALSELKIPRKAADYIKEKIRRYVDNPENRKLDRVGEPWGSKGDKSTTSEPSTSEPSEPSTNKPIETAEDAKTFLSDYGIDFSHLSDEELISAAQGEKEKKEFLMETIDLMIATLKQQRKGAGTNDLTEEEWKLLQKFANGDGPKVPQYDITEDDLNMVIEEIMKRPDGKLIMDILQNKGSAGKGLNRTTRKTLPNPEYDKNDKKRMKQLGIPSKIPGPGAGRDRKVLASFLMCGGRSVVTNKPLSIGEAELDHRLSLDNGGKDEPNNWVWMECRFNQVKSKLSDEALIERTKKELAKTPEERRKERLKDIITNESNEFQINHWYEFFKSTGGNGGITADYLTNLTKPEIKNMIKGWNKLHPKGTPGYIFYHKAQGGNRDRGTEMNRGAMIESALKTLSKIAPMASSEEIAAANKILFDGINEIKTRERE